MHKWIGHSWEDPNTEQISDFFSNIVQTVQNVVKCQASSLRFLHRWEVTPSWKSKLFVISIRLKLYLLRNKHTNVNVLVRKLTDMMA